jgi:1,4-dihydroxy-2-naphthoate octaprenyltransferase
MCATAGTPATGWRVWVLGARPRTLPAAIVPVLVGSAASVGVTPAAPPVAPHLSDRWVNFALAMIVSLALQVATNYANDYSDGKRGTDDPSLRVGPPRLVGNGLASPRAVKRAVILAFGAAALAGGALVLRVGWELVPVGVAAIAAGWFYTGGPRPYGYAGLGEVFVFVFFGVVATVGSTYVQLGRATWTSFGASIAVGAFATAILVANNLRDIPGDLRSGKRTLAVRLGDQRTRLLYCILMVVPYVVLPFVAGLSSRPLAALGFAAVTVGTRPVSVVLAGASGPGLVPVLVGTGRAQLVFGVLVSIGLVVVL